MVMLVDDNVSLKFYEMTRSQDYENTDEVCILPPRMTNRILCPYADQSWAYRPSLDIYLNLR